MPPRAARWHVELLLSIGSLIFTAREFPDHSATSERLACSVGGESHRGKSRNPVAWVAFVKETKRMKPTDKAVLGMVSESSGRNESERRGGPEITGPRGRALGHGAKAAWNVAI